MSELCRILDQIDASRKKDQKVVGIFSAVSNVTGVKADVSREGRFLREGYSSNNWLQCDPFVLATS